LDIPALELAKKFGSKLRSARIAIPAKKLVKESKWDIRLVVIPAKPAPGREQGRDHAAAPEFSSNRNDLLIP
jgi:hypothetical protein